MTAVATAPAPSPALTLMTTEQMLALPKNGVDRWLIQGRLWEKPMTVRNRFHSQVMIRVGQLLANWSDAQPTPRGAVLGGEVGCRLRHTPESTVGIDVIYISPELAAQQSNTTTLIDGVPTLVVEVLSPNDTQDEINAKVDEYLAVGVPLVWVIDAHRHTVLVCRPDDEPALFNVRQELSGEPHLPGLRIPVARIFE